MFSKKNLSSASMTSSCQCLNKETQAKMFSFNFFFFFASVPILLLDLALCALHYRQFRDVLKSILGDDDSVTLFDFIVDFYLLLYHQTFA